MRPKFTSSRPAASLQPAGLRGALPAALVVAALMAAPFAAPRASSAAPPAGGSGAAALDPTALKTYQSLFGADERRVLATSATKDDAQFAATLLEKNKSLTDDPALAEVVCTKAYEFGIKDPEGYAVAIEAAGQMA